MVDPIILKINRKIHRDLLKRLGCKRKKAHFQKAVPVLLTILLIFQIIGGLFLFVPPPKQAQAAGNTYYVDADITDTNVASATPDCTNYDPTAFTCSGGSSSAYKTIADINAFSALAAGDSVLFRRGQIWREQLTVPSSGSAGSPITFGAYGNGDDPIISGATLITPGTSWDSDTGNVNIGDSSVGAAATWRGANYIYFYKITTSSMGTLQSFYVYVGDAGAGHFKCALYDNSGTAGAPGALVTNTTSSSILMTKNAWNDFTISEGANLSASTVYYIAIFSDGAYYASRAGTNGAGYFQALTYNGFPSTATSTSESTNSDFDAYITIFVTGVTNVWNATLTTEPNQVWFDGIIGTKQASKAACTSARDWFWSGNILSVYSTIDPDTAYTNPGIEAGTVDKVINISAKNYITLENLSVEKAKGNGIYNLNGSNLTINSVDVTDGASSANTYQLYLIAFSGTADTITVINSTFSDPYDSGVGCVAVSAATNVSFTNCTASGFNGGAGIGGTLAVGFRFAGTGVSGILSNCTASRIGKAGRGIGFAFFDNAVFTVSDCVANGTEDGFDTFNTAQVVCNRCKSLNNAQADNATAGDGFSTHDTSSLTMNYCLSYNNERTGFSMSTGSTAIVYNSVLYGNDTGSKTSYGIQASASCTITAKNNIIIGHDNDMYTENDTVTIISDYNLFNSSGTTFNWRGTSYSFANWKTQSGQDAHSLNSDPLFVSTVTPDLHLQSTSPAIDAGVDVGLTQDYAENPIYGTPDIGAYEYQPPYNIGTDDIDITSAIRIYSDGKYRYTGTASGGTEADLSISPNGGWPEDDYNQWMDVDIDTWNTSDTYYKKWTETAIGTLSVDHSVGDLKASTYYTLKVDGVRYGTYLSNSSGEVSFAYTGEYSEHEFEIEEDTTEPDVFILSSPNSNSRTSSKRPTLSWNASADSESGLAKYQLYIDNSLDRDNIDSSATSTTPVNNLSCGSHTWYIRAYDNAGNYTDAPTYNLTRSCAGARASYNITFIASPSGAGTVPQSGSYLEETMITATAAPQPGYVFLYWEEQGIEVSRDPAYRFIVDSNRELVARFRAEALVEEQPQTEKPVAEMTISELNVRILQIQQQIINLINQLIQLIQERISQLQT